MLLPGIVAGTLMATACAFMSIDTPIGLLVLVAQSVSPLFTSRVKATPPTDSSASEAPPAVSPPSTVYSNVCSPTRWNTSCRRPR